MRSAHGPLPTFLPLLLALATAAVMPSRASAQTVAGRIVEAGTGQPLPGAFVEAVDAAGERIATAVSGIHGEYVLRLPRAGAVEVRAEYIGKAPAAVGPVRVEADESVWRELALEPRAIALDALRVQAERRCEVRPSDGGPLQRLWEAARRRLEVAAWTRRQSGYRFESVRFERTRDPRDGRLLAQESREVAGGEPTFATLAAEDLVANGFVRPAGDDTHVFYGPGPETILSDAFLDTHCFELSDRTPPAPGLVGLGFEPTRGHRERDVDGVLWLTPAGELHSIEFRFTTVPWPTAGADAHGRIALQRLPTGPLIIRDWVIAIPSAGDVHVSAGARPIVRARELLQPVKEHGGAVHAVTLPDGERVALSESAALAGVVVDSTRGGPLPGARVRLVGPELQAVADAQGRFRFDGLLPGAYRVTFAHPRLDSIGWTPPGRVVQLEAGDEARVTLAVPPIAQRRLITAGGAIREGVIASPAPFDTVYELDPIRVEGRVDPLQRDRMLGGFYTRLEREMGGTFFTPEELERRNASRLSHILGGVNAIHMVRRSRAPGEPPGGPVPVVRGATRMEEGACHPLLFVDGVRFRYDPFDPAGIDVVSPIEIEALEVYAGASTVPPEFMSADSDCGVILVWLKRGPGA